MKMNLFISYIHFGKIINNMSAMFEGGYRIKDGKIQELCEGAEHYNVDWGYVYDPDYWITICDDTPENRKKYNL